MCSSDLDGVNSIVRWELAEDGAGCQLVLTNTLLKKEHLLGVATGWHTHLEELADCLARAERRAWQTERFNAFRGRARVHVARYKTFLPNEAVANAKLSHAP